MSNYFRVFLTFARNSLVRDMTFRANFLIDMISSIGWVLMNLGFYVLIFHYTPAIGAGTGWGKYQFFLFLATTPVDQQPGAGVLHDQRRRVERTDPHRRARLRPAQADRHAVPRLAHADRVVGAGQFRGRAGADGLRDATSCDYVPGLVQIVLYPLYVVCGVAIYYSLMIALAATSVWLGRNQTLFDFWFYITNFSRYPMEIYHGPWGTPLRRVFTFFIPVLVVVNVPARMLVRPISPQTWEDWLLPVFALLATVASLAASRWVFQRALWSYRSASS